MLLAEAGKIRSLIPTAAREVFDVSGAGDTVIASLTWVWFQARPLKIRLNLRSQREWWLERLELQLPHLRKYSPLFELGERFSKGSVS